MYYNLTGLYFLQKEHIQKLYMNEQPVKLSLYLLTQKEHIQKLYMNEQPVKLSLYLLTTGDHSQGSTYRATQYVTRW